MTPPTTEIKRRGRKPKNEQFAKLTKWGRENLKFSDSGQADEINSRHIDGVSLRGVSHCAFARPDEDKWNVLFYMAGHQHNLGIYSLHTATRLYDALLVHFEKYRKRRPSVESEESWFNFSRDQATTDLAENDSLKMFIDTLAAYWKSEGRLVSQEAREDVQAKKSRERQARKTAVAAVNTWGGDLRAILFEMQTTQEIALAEINKKLDELGRCVTIPPAETNNVKLKI